VASVPASAAAARAYHQSFDDFEPVGQRNQALGKLLLWRSARFSQREPRSRGWSMLTMITGHGLLAVSFFP